MSGALSLRQDILALVRKHSDTCLPEDLLARLAENARLMGVGEQIRSLHDADPFGLFSEASVEDSDDDYSGSKAARKGRVDGGDGGEGQQLPDERGSSKTPTVLPDNVKRMLAIMRVTRLDKVAALNGFSTIDAEVEFSQSNNANTESTSIQTLASSNGYEASGAKRSSSEKSARKRDPSSSEEDMSSSLSLPVHLTFRFRREPLSKNRLGGNADDELAFEVGTTDIFDSIRSETKSGVKIVNLDDEEENKENEENEENEEKTTVVSNGDANGNNISKKGVASVAAEGRKRAGSRVGEADGEGGQGKGRKRTKGTEVEVKCGQGDNDSDGDDDSGDDEEDDAEDAEEDDEKEEGDCEGEACQIGCCGGKSSEPDEEGLDYEPRTLVSYSVSGGIGHESSDSLLQAVLYARGDGPACVMTPPVEEGGDDKGGDTDDQEDVFDCNVDGPALEAVGRALGLHTDPLPSSNSLHANGNGQESKRSENISEDIAGGGMTLSDLVWWIMMFPFFEKEFDMVDVVASSVFGDDSDDSDDSDEDSEKGSDTTGDEAGVRLADSKAGDSMSDD